MPKEGLNNAVRKKGSSFPERGNDGIFGGIDILEIFYNRYSHTVAYGV